MTITPSQQRLMELFNCDEYAAQRMIDRMQQQPSEKTFVPRWDMPYSGSKIALSRLLKMRPSQPMFKMDGGALAAQEMNASSVYQKYLDEHLVMGEEPIRYVSLELKMGGLFEELKLFDLSDKDDVADTGEDKEDDV